MGASSLAHAFMLRHELTPSESCLSNTAVNSLQNSCPSFDTHGHGHVHTHTAQQSDKSHGARENTSMRLTTERQLTRTRCRKQQGGNEGSATFHLLHHVIQTQGVHKLFWVVFPVVADKTTRCRKHSETQNKAAWGTPQTVLPVATLNRHGSGILRASGLRFDASFEMSKDTLKGFHRVFIRPSDLEKATGSKRARRRRA